jgi:NAD-dependent deacetylase
MKYKSKYQINPDDRVVVLTGAGISAESGIKTFRDSNGLWESHKLEDVATPEAFIRNPQLVWDFYRERYKQACSAQPNEGHKALTALRDYLGDNLTLITQNIDGLHLQAGSNNVLEMHGTIHNSFCFKCGQNHLMKDVRVTDTLPSCTACKGYLRPDIVWFGEVPYHLDEIMNCLQTVEYFLVIGTSGVVYPAAQFLVIAKNKGAKCIGINLDPPDNASFLDEFHQGKSGVVLPQLLEQWTKSAKS